MLRKCIIFLSFCVIVIKCGCRKQEVNECESICRTNDKGKMSCELRGAIILPNLSTIEASLPRVSSHLIFRICSILFFSITMFDVRNQFERATYWNLMKIISNRGINKCFLINIYQSISYIKENVKINF